jgi:exopolysaccharide biosynthesis WecB/TagA/CpsF family protein
MHKIFFSAMAYDSGKSGISVYINNVLRELAKEHQLEVLALRDDIELLPKSENIKYLKVSSFLRKPLINMLWHLFILPCTLSWKKYDLVILPAGNRRLLQFYRKFTIAVVHDLSQYHVEQKYDCFRMFYCKKVLPFYLKRVNRVVAVSGSTANDLERFWKIPASRITVNHNGFDKYNFNSSPVDSSEILTKYNIKKKYILYVSRIEHPGKNHLNLIKAYERLPEKLQAEYDLVLGGSFWTGAEAVKEYAEKSQITENIKFIGFVKHEDLPALYHAASLYIFPSLFEGFGLSLLEAMACGVPTACSETSSLGEIAADAALQFDPAKIDEIRSAMQDVLEKPSLRKQLVGFGFERLKMFDWKEHAAELVDLYKESNNVLPRSSRFDVFIRIFTSLIALVACIMFTLPLLVYTLFRRIFTGKEMFYREKIYGKNEVILNLRYFNVDNVILRKASLFYYVLIFDLRLVGVSIRTCSGENRQIGDSDLFMDSPGILSLWFLRMSRGIAYSGRLDTELNYVTNRNFAGDMMIILRSILAIIFFNANKEFYPKINLMNVEFDNLSMKDAIDALTKDITEGKRKKIYYVNADCFNKVVKDKNYLDLLQKGDYILPDGIGVLLACKMLQVGLRENVNGTDMLPFICQMAVEGDYSIYLFGAKPGVAAAMRQKLMEVYPGLRIVGERNGYFSDDLAEKEMIDEINLLKPDILLVALGVPAQEEWIEKHCDELPCRLMIGVGGLFDFYSGNIKRAPLWLREMGLEWIFRLAMEPKKKFKRYTFGNSLFLWRVFRWKRKMREKNI